MDQLYHDPMRAPYIKQRSYSGIGMSIGVVLLAAARLQTVVMRANRTDAHSGRSRCNAAPSPAARNPAAEETTGQHRIAVIGKC